MKLTHLGLGALMLLMLSLALVACSGDDSKKSGTGVPAVDDAIAAIIAGDATALAEQAVFSQIGCTNVDGLGGPPKCGPGQAEGTQLEVLPAAACEGYYLTSGEIAGSFEAFVNADSKVHGIFRSGGIADFFSGSYVILLDVNDPQYGGQLAREAYVSDKGVTGLFFGCGQSVQDLIAAHTLEDELAYTP
jgi:hypothetical protein